MRGKMYTVSQSKLQICQFDAHNQPLSTIAAERRGAVVGASDTGTFLPFDFCTSSVSAVSDLTQLCDHSGSGSVSSTRLQMHHHLSTLLNESWIPSCASNGLVSGALKAMCGVLQSGSA